MRSINYLFDQILSVFFGWLVEVVWTTSKNVTGVHKTSHLTFFLCVQRHYRGHYGVYTRVTQIMSCEPLGGRERILSGPCHLKRSLFILVTVKFPRAPSFESCILDGS